MTIILEGNITVFLLLSNQYINMNSTVASHHHGNKFSTHIVEIPPRVQKLISQLMKGVLPRDQLSGDQLPIDQLPTGSTHGKLIYCCPATEYDRSFYHVTEYIRFFSTILVMGTTSYGRWFTHNLLLEGKMEAAGPFILLFSYLSALIGRSQCISLACILHTVAPNADPDSCPPKVKLPP